MRGGGVNPRLSMPSRMQQGGVKDDKEWDVKVVGIGAGYQGD